MSRDHKGGYLQINTDIKDIHRKYCWNDKLPFVDIILQRVAEIGNDLFVLSINTELTEKKPIWFVLQCNSFHRRQMREHFPANVQFKFLPITADSNTTNTCPLVALLLDQNWNDGKHPLDYMLVNSESIVIWALSARSHAYKSERGIVSWMCVLMSICLHSSMPAQTFVKSSPYYM